MLCSNPARNVAIALGLVTAALYGATGHASVPPPQAPASFSTVPVETSEEMRAQVLEALAAARTSPESHVSFFLDTSAEPPTQEPVLPPSEADPKTPVRPVDPVQPDPNPPRNPTGPTVPSSPVGGISNVRGIGLIVNIGRFIWTFISNNQPVINTQHMYATALPKGVSDASQLTHFSDLQFQSFRHSGKNIYGMKMFDVTYTLVHQYGGDLNGKGQYLTNVSVVPNKVDVLWGYTLNVLVDNVSTLNMGTLEDPIGGLKMEVAFQIETIMRKLHYKNIYQFRGDRREVQMLDSLGSKRTN